MEPAQPAFDSAQINPVLLRSENLATQHGSTWIYLPFCLDLSPEILMLALLTEIKYFRNYTVSRML